MSYYRYITGVTKSFRPPTRALRSSSVPRHVPPLDTARYARSSSVPPSASFSTSFFTRHSATPFRDRAASLPPVPAYKSLRYTTASDQGSHYSDFDYKVIDYMGKLERQDMVKTLVSQSKYQRSSEKRVSDSFSSSYNYYDGGKHGRDYLYPVTKDVLGSWKHYNLSSHTLTERNQRATSPLQSRELDRSVPTGYKQTRQQRHAQVLWDSEEE